MINEGEKSVDLQLAAHKATPRQTHKKANEYKNGALLILRSANKMHRQQKNPFYRVLRQHKKQRKKPPQTGMRAKKQKISALIPHILIPFICILLVSVFQSTMKYVSCIIMAFMPYMELVFNGSIPMLQQGSKKEAKNAIN